MPTEGIGLGNRKAAPLDPVQTRIPIRTTHIHAHNAMHATQKR